MVAMKLTDMEHLPNTCDECKYYSCIRRSYAGWSETCELCGHCIDWKQDSDWYYDGKGRPINCPLIEINN